MKTSELTGTALDWAVAKCEGLLTEEGGNLQLFGNRLATHASSLGTTYTPSTDWAQGGPIIEREGINVNKEGPLWWAHREQLPHCHHEADRPLIAAMRCYVASKLGDDVELPEELT